MGEEEGRMGDDERGGEEKWEIMGKGKRGIMEKGK